MVRRVADTALFGAEACADSGLRAFFFPITRPQASGRGTLTPDDLAQIATVHEIGFHTATHRSAPAITVSNVAAEVDRPLAELEAATGRRPGSQLGCSAPGSIPRWWPTAGCVLPGWSS